MRQGLIGAVNTIYLKDGKLYGENTDGKGFLTSLINEGKVEPKGKKVVVLGAGGAARAITVELALAGSVLAAKKNSSILLVDNKDITKQKEFINKQKITNIILLGGEGVIGKDIATSLKKK